MKSFLMWDKYENRYRMVVDKEELKKYIQEKVIELKNKKVEDMFITASQGKLDTIIVLDNILNDLEVEDD